MGGRQGLLALAVAPVLVVAIACGGADADPDTGPDAGPTSTAPSGESTTPSSSTPVADPDHAVDPPGPFDGQLSADMLVFDQQVLGPDVIRQLEKVRGVAAVEPMALGQVVIENQAINLAAVDPGSYRRFTPINSAEFQEAWDRVAGGEVAITPALGKRLQDDEGNLTLGSAADAPEVHIGAFAPQAEQIDAVVNVKWGEELSNMEFGNAVLLSTGRRAPESVRTSVQEIVPGTASVQRLDIAARLGLDTSVQQTAFLTGGSVADVVGTFNYTVLGGGRIAPDPSWVSSHIGTEVMPIIGPMTCNRAIFPQLRAALNDVVTQGLADELNPDEYAGCYYPRFIAGSTTLSNHSFGLAMDFNVPGNQRGTVGEMDRGVVAIFKKWGFAWGGDWNYTDPMHFEMNALVDPR